MPRAKTKPKSANTPATGIGVIVSPGQANWGSCHTIGTNLRFAYEAAERKLSGKQSFEYINYGEKLGKKDLSGLAKSILAKNFSCVSFIDHWPPAFGLIREMFAAAKGRELPAFIIHVYGDFTFYSTDMVSTFYLLRGQKVRPICASERQVRLVNGLLSADKKSIGYVPFPVNTKIYFPDAGIRAEERKALGWGEDEYVMLYTGRISMQKNVTTAIAQFFEHLKKNPGYRKGMKFRFALAGKYDDLGAPFFGNSPPKNEYFFRIRNIAEGIDPNLGTVSYLGNFEPEKLNRVYNAADGFMSLSLHHDEDYGMSPAEALATGLPCVLSDWGGYTSFARVNSISQKQVWLVTVGIDGKGPHFAEPILKDSLRGILNSPRSMPERIDAARRFQELFSIEAVGNQLEQEIANAQESSVQGASKIFLELAKRAIDIRNGKAVRIYHSYEDPLYQKIYSPYHGLE